MLTVITPYTIAQRFIGAREAPGAVHNAQILAMLQLADRSIHGDETPWCSAFVHYVTWLLDVPRSKSLSARSWLRIGTPVALNEARAGYDVVVVSRGEHPPPASILDAPGHVGFFSRVDFTNDRVELLGGNQGDRVCFAWYPIARVLGIRRLA